MPQDDWTNLIEKQESSLVGALNPSFIKQWVLNFSEIAPGTFGAEPTVSLFGHGWVFDP